MGYTFNVILVLFVAPLLFILFGVWVVTKKKFFGIVLGKICLGVGGLVLVVNYFTTPVRLKQPDIYGEYVIDRSMFPGKNADWQYDHYRFEVTEDDSIHFHVTDKNRIIRTYSGTVKFLSAYRTPRIVIAIDTPRNHIIEEMPTLYRRPFSFYYVFRSPYYGNVFFTHGKWESNN